MSGFVPLFVVPGGLELVIIVVAIIMLFGPNKLLEVARSFGQAQAEFQKGHRTVSRDRRHPSPMPSDIPNDPVQKQSPDSMTETVSS
ncbi:MAG TPA: twin-arginine translocase TatA/TatE family subunit [Halococcus sp.]|nr:twin-arginine translocase TatA/TatE family subunit [Halococcus sp.]